MRSGLISCIFASVTLFACVEHEPTPEHEPRLDGLDADSGAPMEDGAVTEAHPPTCESSSKEEKHCRDSSGAEDEADDARTSLTDTGAAEASTQQHEAVCETRTVCVNGNAESWKDVCLQSIFQLPSAGLYRVCVANDQQKMGVMTLRGDLVVTNDGWTHSAYGNGNIRSTLSAENEGRCSEMRANLDPAASFDSCRLRVGP